jgi:hypothetical protein
MAFRICVFKLTIMFLIASFSFAASPEFLWSRRWLESELARSDKTDDKIAAYSVHLKRVQALANDVAVRTEVGARGGTHNNLDAAQYLCGRG